VLPRATEVAVQVRRQDFATGEDKNHKGGAHF